MPLCNTALLLEPWLKHFIKNILKIHSLNYTNFLLMTILFQTDFFFKCNNNYLSAIF